MRFYDISFFCDDEIKPQVHMRSLGFIKGGTDMTVVVNIVMQAQEQDPYGRPSVSLFFHGEQDLINFKNSVLEAYEAYERGKKKP